MVNKITGVVVLTVTCSLMLWYSLRQAQGLLYSILLTAIVVLFLVGLLYHIVEIEWRSMSRLQKSHKIEVLLVAVIAATTTYYFSIRINWNPLVASSIVGLIASLCLPKNLIAVAYTAAFAGMSSDAILIGIERAVLVGTVVGLLCVLTEPFYQGFGGRLGTIALGAVFLTLFVVTYVFP